MKIKRLLGYALIIALPVFLLFAFGRRSEIADVVRELQDPGVIISLVFASGILLLAHSIRAYKTKQLLDTIKVTSWRTHTRALFIGYLFNALLPFRLGELIRAIVAGKGTKMSATFMFGLVLLERAFDGFILGLFILWLLIGTSVFDSPAVHSLVLTAATLLVTITALILILLLTLRLQPAWLLRLCHAFTSLFNDSLRDSLRFKIWSLMYGLERVINLRRLLRYFALSLFMWALYLTAVLPLSYHYLNKPGLTTLAGNSTISYLGISAPAGPSYIGSYQRFVQPYIDNNSDSPQLRKLLMIAWLLQVLPAFAVGFVFVVRTHETLQKPVRSGGSKNADLTGDKLLRDIDISRDLGSFLDAFFTNNSLSRIMHRMEVGKNSKLIQYFKGGSDAVTALVYEDNRFLVRKITPIQYKYKLKSQYDWLTDKSNVNHIVKAISDETTDTYYKIDLEYNEQYLPFFDYIHSKPINSSKQILSQIFEHLFKSVYKVGDQITEVKDFEKYIQNRCLSKIRQAAEVNDELRSLIAYDKLTINGKSYKNIHIVIDEILADKKLCQKLSTYRKCSVHGDVTIDNILASKEDDSFLLIDPNDNENEISGPVFDFGRLGESLLYGYEFLNRDESKVSISDNNVEFEHARSHNYAELEKHMLKLQKQYLTPEESFAVPFHVAVMYSRMLTHRVNINPLNAAKYYATSVVAFNKFLGEAKK